MQYWYTNKSKQKKTTEGSKKIQAKIAQDVDEKQFDAIAGMVGRSGGRKALADDTPTIKKARTLTTPAIC